MGTLRILIALLMVGVFHVNSFTQTTVEGKVIDRETLEPLVGAKVVVLGTQNGAITEAQGNFKLANTSKTDSVKVFFLGYDQQTVSVNDCQLIELRPSQLNFDQVIVSASREEQLRTEAPISITTISPELINDTKATSLDQILNKVNGVYMVDLGNEQHSMSMRQPLSYGSLFLYLEDGIPIRTTGVFNHNALIEMNMANVRSIEVIKGPASSLYGSEAIGGAINFISHRPTAIPTATVQLQGNNLGYKRADFVASNSWKKFGIVASGYYANRSNGPRDHSDFQKLALSVRGDWRINEKSVWTNDLSYIDYQTDMTGGLDSANFFNQDFTSLHTFTYRKVNALRFKSSFKRFWNKKSKTNFTGFIRDNAIGQNPHYRVKDDYKPWMGTGNPLLAHGEENVNSFKSYGLVVQHQQKFDLLKTKWITGASVDFSPNSYEASYISINKNTNGIYTGYNETDSLLANYDVGILNTSAYSQVQVSPTEDLKIVGAVRFDRIDYNYDNHLDSTAFSGAPDEKNHFEQVTPKIGATYDFGKNVGVYANYSVGFSPPDVTELYRGVTVPTLQPSQYNNYEVGGWLSFWQNKVFVDLSVYQLDGVNEIISVLQDDGSTEKENAGQTQHRGIEYTVKVNPVKDVSLRFSGANAQHIFLNYIEKGTDYRGNFMATAPQFIANAEVIYKPRFVNGLRVAVEWQHVGSYFLDAANSEEYPGYHLINLRLGYRFKGFDIWFNTLNLTDELYATVASKSAWGKSYRIGNPRSFNVGVAYTFKGKK